MFVRFDLETFADLPVLHPGHDLGGSVDSSSLERSIPADIVEALATEELHLPAHAIDGRVVRDERAGESRVDDAARQSKLRVGLEGGEDVAKIVGVEGDIGVHVTEEL